MEDHLALANSLLGSLLGGSVGQTTAQGDWGFARVLLATSSNGAIAHRSAEFDLRVGVAEKLYGKSLAAGTEIRIMADSTLVAIANDEAMLGIFLAERSIISDSELNRTKRDGTINSVMDWHEALAVADNAGVLDAGGTVVPIKASQALMTDSTDGLGSLALLRVRREH